MKKLCIRLAKTKWNKIKGAEHVDEIVRDFKTIEECKKYLNGINDTSLLITEKHFVVKCENSVEIVITENIENYYTSYFWWISTID